LISVQSRNSFLSVVTLTRQSTCSGHCYLLHLCKEYSTVTKFKISLILGPPELIDEGRPPHASTRLKAIIHLSHTLMMSPRHERISIHTYCRWENSVCNDCL